MKRYWLIFFMVCAICGVAAEPTLEWRSLGNSVAEDGTPCHTERITIHTPGAIKKLCFNRFARRMYPVNSQDTITEIVPGYYAITSPRFRRSGNATIEIDMYFPWGMENMNYAPDGFHALLDNGKVVPISYIRHPLVERSQWATSVRDLMPRGSDIYRFNEKIAYKSEPGPYDIIPSFKSVTFTDSGSYWQPGGEVEQRRIDNPTPDYYRIIIKPQIVTIEYTSRSSLLMAQRVLYERLIPANQSGLPAAIIEDYPSFNYRAMMMDIARNYFNVSKLQNLVHILASYRFNTLHFHPVDDEAWRLEIPGLPELTNVGARRGYTTDESSYLVQIFSGNGNPDTDEGTANGYLTRQEFIDFLKYCHSLGINVIPEIESPGHARAAIKAMQARARMTGDTSYLLSEGDADTSVFTSAQAFHDNVMNPALPGTYKFMAHLFDELISMYDEARVPLMGIHIGGDEVPAQAWESSPAVQRMMAENKLTTQRQVHAAFVDSLARLLSERGIKMYGWQEIANGHEDDYNRRISVVTGGVNCWTHASQSIAAKAMEAGFPVILSCVNKCYLDQMYSNHPLEKGLNWGGNVDEFATFSAYPSALGVDDYRATTSTGGSVVGLSGHLFGETLRRWEDVQNLILPKICGLAERAWNTDSTYTESQFNAILAERELPLFARKGYNFHLRQPGLLIEENIIYMNSPYRNAVIRYTLNGTEPTEDSPIYENPLTMQPGDNPRAKLFYLGKSSLTTYPDDM
ncbi:MAG: family 20 glycosylhydrolase [Muribaculaceae bacterium]|nr:family 20 glycosylhydrolase [Muribaculaceae bacterium]